MVNKIRVLSLFSGYGTDNFALKRLGLPYECVGYSDIDKYANQCFRQNHINIIKSQTGCHISWYPKELGDVTKIDPNKLEDFNLLTGGFPCQAFSVAGKGLGELDTRGTLFREIIRIAEVKKPKYMLLENVKGLTTKKHKPTFEKILSELGRIGYYVHWRILNTKDYGIPQNRERVWFVCFRDKSEYNNFNWPEKEELKIFIKDLMDSQVERPSIKNKRISQILQCPTGKENPCFQLEGDTPSGVSRQNDRIYSTISPCLNCVVEQIVVHLDGTNHVLTGPEHFRLQGFNENEINLDNLTERQVKKLAGNGQSVNVVEKIFKEMFKSIITQE